MLLKFSVAHINFIVVALVNIINKYNTCVALHFYPNMQKKKPTLYSHWKATRKLNLKSSVGDWELVWPALIIQSNVLEKSGPIHIFYYS